MTRRCCRIVDHHQLGVTRFHVGSVRFRSTMAALPVPEGVYSIASVFASFQDAATSDQLSPAVHTSSFTSDSGATRHTAIWLIHRFGQTSAVTMCKRSGESWGSAGRSKRRFVVRARMIKLIDSPAVE